MINTQNIVDNECFKWCLFKCLNPSNHYPTRITNTNKDSAKKLDFKDLKFPVKISDIYKIEKKIPSALVILTMKIRKNIQSMYLKNLAKKNVLTYYWQEGEKNTMFLSMISTDSCMINHYIVEENSLSFFFTCIHYTRNVKASYWKLL